MYRYYLLLLCMAGTLQCLGQRNVEYQELEKRLDDLRATHAKNKLLIEQSLKSKEFIQEENRELEAFARNFENEREKTWEELMSKPFSDIEKAVDISKLKEQEVPDKKDYDKIKLYKVLKDALNAPFSSATINLSELEKQIKKVKGNLTQEQNTDIDKLWTTLQGYEGCVTSLKGIVETLSNSKSFQTLKEQHMTRERWKQIDNELKKNDDAVQKILAIPYLNTLLQPIIKHTGNPFKDFDTLKRQIESMK